MIEFFERLDHLSAKETPVVLHGRCPAKTPMFVVFGKETITCIRYRTNEPISERLGNTD